MVRDVVAHAEGLYLTIPVQFEKQVLIKVLEKLLHTLRIDREGQAVRAERRIQHWVHVDVREKDGLGYGRLVVKPGATVAVATRACRRCDGSTVRA